VNFVRFLAATHILRVNCAKMAKDTDLDIPRMTFLA